MEVDTKLLEQIINNQKRTDEWIDEIDSYVHKEVRSLKEEIENLKTNFKNTQIVNADFMKAVKIYEANWQEENKK